MYVIIGPEKKEYIGITIRENKHRYRGHVNAAQRGVDTPLYRSVRKHGWEKFQFKVIVTANDWDYLCLIERAAIKRFDTIAPRGYNLTGGGEGIIDRAEESRLKSSKSLRASWAKDDGTRRNDHRGVIAMAAALANDPDLEAGRRVKISQTMKRRGVGRGVSNGFSKLALEDIDAIRNALRSGERDRPIAERFGVHRKLINMIRYGKRWNDGSVYPPLPHWSTDPKVKELHSARTRAAMMRPDVQAKIRKSRS